MWAHLILSHLNLGPQCLNLGLYKGPNSIFLIPFSPSSPPRSRHRPVTQMANTRRLSKIKSVLKRWHSSSRLGSSSSSSSISRDYDTWHPSTTDGDPVPSGLHAVLVGKDRRRYLIRADLVDHPVFRRLAGHDVNAGGDATVVGCEVVLFEHLLWMLENSDPATESLDDLAQFYEC